MTKQSKTTTDTSEEVVAPNLKPSPSAAKPFTGSDLEKFNSVLVAQVTNAMWLGHGDAGQRDIQMQACLGAMAGIGPKDETEGLLVAQMVMLHNAAAECFRRAMISDQPFPSRQMNLNFATKLTRAYALHMETLDKHRGKGQQTVRVEHVTVNAGGQAIVGNVTGGGGSGKKSEDQSHAKQVAHAPESEMRSPFEKDRETVPVACDEER
jgi:hypothetical protein